MVRPPKGTGEQIGSNLVMNAIEAMSKVSDRARELVRNALDPSGRASPFGQNGQYADPPQMCLFTRGSADLGQLHGPAHSA